MCDKQKQSDARRRGLGTESSQWGGGVEGIAALCDGSTLSAP